MANELTAEKTMTTKEVAQALGVSYDTINNSVKRLFPKIVKNGKTTFLNEMQVACISRELKSNAKVTEQLTFEAGSKVKNAVTAMELQQNFYQAAQAYAKYLEAEKARLEEENKRLSVENESLEFALEYDKAKDCVNWGEWKKANHIKASFSQIAKELNLEEGEDYFRQVLADGSRFPTIRVKESCLQSIFENYSAR